MNVSAAGACVQGTKILSGSACTTRCTTGYVASVASLSCSFGAFTPATFTCNLAPAPAPASGGVFDFPCANMAGETFPVPAGTYTIQAIALNESFQALAQLTFQQRLFGKSSLGHIIFQVR